jgi:hypothetical protein
MKKAITIVRIISITSVVFFLFYPINFFSFAFAYKETQVITLPGIVARSFFAYAWFAWVVMATAWVFQRQLPRFWPISGSIIGAISFIFLLPFVVPAFLVLPAVLLAITFCKFHLHSNS